MAPSRAPTDISRVHASSSSTRTSPVVERPGLLAMQCDSDSDTVLASATGGRPLTPMKARTRCNDGPRSLTRSSYLSRRYLPSTAWGSTHSMAVFQASQRAELSTAPRRRISSPPGRPG